MFEFLSALNSVTRRNASRQPGLARKLACEYLEDRTTPTVSAITSNFNGTAIPAGDFVWFSAVAKVSGVGSSPVTVDVDNQTIDFTSNGTPYTLNVPDSTITLDPSLNHETGVASTSFGSGGWSVTAPASFSGNVFIGGLGWQTASGLAGGSVKNITWSGDFHTDTAGISVNWQWAAAVYTEFTSDMSGIQVKTVDDNHADVYQNSDHAGTPENFKNFVIGGARGGGGSNWTGSYSGTASVVPDAMTNQTETASISGNVQYSMMGENQGGAVCDTVTLTNAEGVVVATTTTDYNGNYSFGSLPAGTYTVTVFDLDLNGGSASISVTVTGGQVSTGNDFTINN
ncbi:MAG TPA: carboxypeptidase regulatory-like domain-containing protein [Gemmata sp.]|nr:carboxypeptidase regulatory-like domain-containing protein [Gemmata sp.]